MYFRLRSYAAGAALSCLISASAWAVDEPLEQLVVTASRVEQPISDVIGSVTVITRDQIEQRQSQSLQDLLRGEAGIDISNSGGLGKVSALYLRGANSTQTLILVDGVRMGSATAGMTSLELLPLDQIDHIEIVRGPRSSLYGSDAIGGVIQIFTRKMNGFSASAGTGSYNTQDYAAGFGMQSNGLRFSVNGAYQTSTGFNACRSSAGCFTTEPDDDGYHNGSASAQLGYSFGKVADLELNTLYTQGLTEFDGSFVNQTRFRNTAPNLKLRVNVNNILSLTVAGGITQDISESYKNNVYGSRFNTEKRNAAAQLDWQLGLQQLSIGGDYLNDMVDSDTHFTQTERHNTGVFAQYLGKLGTHELSASARYDDNQQFGSHNTGNLGWKWFAVPRALTFNAGWGSAFHAPTFNDLYYPFGYGNPNLRPERSQSYELGASGQTSFLNWSLQTYATQAKDLIAYNSAFLPDNISKARIQGLELTLSNHWQQLTTSLNYTAQDLRSRAAGSNYNHVLARRSRQAGRLDLTYDFGGAQVTTTINSVGPRFDDLANTQRLGGYTIVDFKADVALCKALTLQVKLGNFFDRQYETAHYYNQEGRSIFVTLRYQPGK
jgi:vitamin B12 transporter